MRKAFSVSVLCALVLILSFSGWAQSGVVTLKGEITNVLQHLAIFQSEEGREYTLHLGPVGYWRQENLTLRMGPAEITGEAEEVNGEWNFYPYRIKQGETIIDLASDDGVPLWDRGTFP